MTCNLLSNSQTNIHGAVTCTTIPGTGRGMQGQSCKLVNTTGKIAREA